MCWLLKNLNPDIDPSNPAGGNSPGWAGRAAAPARGAAGKRGEDEDCWISAQALLQILKLFFELSREAIAEFGEVSLDLRQNRFPAFYIDSE